MNIPVLELIPYARLRRWTRSEVYRLLDVGILNGDRDEYLELIDGLLINKVRPMTPQHAAMTGKARKILGAALPPCFSVWPVCPLAIDEYNEPEPDVLVVAGGADDFITDHPRPADTRLLVEIADDTLDFDRNVKARLYARAGITDYWIVDLVNQCLEIYRDPQPGGHYQDVQTYSPDETISPLMLPDTEIRVADLLPPSS